MFKPQGLEFVFDLIKQAMEGRTSNDERIDWALVTVLYKLLFVLCFNDNVCS